MLTQILSIARTALIESLRQPIFFVIVILSGICQLISTWGTGFAMGLTESGEVSGDNKLLLDVGLSNVFVCGGLLATFIATAVLSKEIENKTVLTIVSKPVPRPVVILGKYLGVAAAILIAVVTMLVFLMMGLRHGVMSNASDVLDMPVIVFTGAAVIGSMLIAAWCNFFYGWHFTQTCVTLMAPAAVAAYLLVLLFSKKWEVQSLITDLKPQITFASVGLTMAILVLASIATAVSTRLGQVMTIVACVGVFTLGLLSNYFLGSAAFTNAPVAIIRDAVPANALAPGWADAGDAYTITFRSPPSPAPKVGDPFFYGPSPNGFPLSVERFKPFTGQIATPTSFLGAEAASLVITETRGNIIVAKKSGVPPLRYDRPPQRGDFVFTNPTRINAPALAIWAVIPNMQDFWLLDAVTQNQPIPIVHILAVILYGLLLIIAALALGVILFQRRDVG
jgi:ABC-type transport system involved in multi-copper enzyme maturation permease subunit